MSCPTVIRVSTKSGPPGIGLPAGSAQQDGFAIVKDGATPYLYKLVEIGQIGLPQALGVTASPTFAGLTLTSLQNQAQGLALVSTTGQLQRVSIGSGLAIQNGALVATATGNGSGTVTSVGLAVPTGFTVSGSPVTTNGTLAFDFLPEYSLPTTAKQNQWDATTTAFSNHLQAADPHSIYTTEVEVNAIIAALTHLDVSITGAITQDVRNDSGATMAAGTPYHVVGAVGDTSRMRVIVTRADDPATMPANGILQQTLTATGGGADGHGVVGGVVTGLNTAGGTEGSTIWVGLTGGISLTRPATNPQPIGTISRVHASTGSVAVAIGPVLSTPAFTGAYGDLSGRPALAAVATSGAYGDLSGRPPDISQTNAEEGVATAFSLWSAQRWRQAAAAWWLSISSAVGRSVVGAVDAPAARSAISAAGSGSITSSGLTQATARLLGRTTAGTGAVEEISVGTGLSLSSGTLSATASGSGTKTLARFTARDNQPPASNFATLDTRNSISVLEFDAATEETAAFISVIPEGANLTSGLLVRIWWMADTATSGNVRWAASFERSGTDLDADSFDTVTEVTSAANGTSGIESIAEIACTAIDSLAAGERFRLRIARKAADAVNDTMTGDAQLVAVEVRGVA